MSQCASTNALVERTGQSGADANSSPAKTLLELAWSKFVDPTCRHQNEGKEAAAFVTTG
jgi:hypothetical protein